MSIISRLKQKQTWIKLIEYFEGLALSELNNIEGISETLKANYHQMQHFIADSTWDVKLLAYPMKINFLKQIQSWHKRKTSDGGGV